MQRNKVGILTFATVIALGACSDSTEPEMDPLTEAEAAELANFLMGQSFGATGMPVSFQEIARMDPGTRPPLAMARVDFDQTVTESADCPLGGSVEVTATVEGFSDDETGEFQVDANQTQVYQSCAGQGESDFSFTLDSAPSVVSDFYLAMDAQGDMMALGFVEGALDWTSGDRSGRCLIDFEFDIETEGQSLSMSASGVVCNVTLDQNITVTG